MVPSPLLAAVVAALSPHTRLVLVGDGRQLPPIGPGEPFRLLLQTDAVPIFRLTQVKRNSGPLKDAANRVLAGELPPPRRDDESEGGTLWHPVEVSPDSTAACEMLLCGVADRLRIWGTETSRKLQVLSPQRKGPLGTTTLNALIQRMAQQTLYGVTLPTPVALGDYSRPDFYLHDKVLFTRNDYDLGTRNGDLGQIVDVSGPRGARTFSVELWTEEKTVEVAEEYHHLELAYATLSRSTSSREASARKSSPTATTCTASCWRRTCSTPWSPGRRGA